MLTRSFALITVALSLLIGLVTVPRVHAQGDRQSPAGSTVQRPPGCLQIDILPRRALVFVDGQPMGHVDEFSGYYHHLTLPAGYHDVAIFAAGYLPLVFSITVVPERTVRLKADLQEFSTD